MHIKLSIDNRFISLCNVDVKFDENSASINLVPVK